MLKSHTHVLKSCMYTCRLSFNRGGKGVGACNFCTPVCPCCSCSPTLHPRGVVPDLLDVVHCAICIYRGGEEGVMTSVAVDVHPRGGRLGAVVIKA